MGVVRWPKLFLKLCINDFMKTTSVIWCRTKLQWTQFNKWPWLKFRAFRCWLKWGLHWEKFLAKWRKSELRKPFMVKTDSSVQQKILKVLSEQRRCKVEVRNLIPAVSSGPAFYESLGWKGLIIAQPKMNFRREKFVVCVIQKRKGFEVFMAASMKTGTIMQVTRTYETSVNFCKTTRRYSPDGSSVQEYDSICLPRVQKNWCLGYTKKICLKRGEENMWDIYWQSVLWRRSFFSYPYFTAETFLLDINVKRLDEIYYHKKYVCVRFENIL
jgi:hypothetical protein